MSNQLIITLEQKKFNAVKMGECLEQIKESLTKISQKFPNMKINYRCKNSTGGIKEGVSKK